MIRRILLVASMLVVLWGRPAWAQSYGDVLDTAGSSGGSGQVVAAGGAVAGYEGDDGSLAATGSNITPLIQAAIVLIGGGTMLVFVARRRHLARRAAA